MGILEATESLKTLLSGGTDRDGGIPSVEKASGPETENSTAEASPSSPEGLPTPEHAGGRRRRLPSLPHLSFPHLNFPHLDLREKWNSVAITIGMGFLNFWNKKFLIFPILLVCCAVTVWYHNITQSLLSFTLAVTFLLTTLLLAFIGLVVMDYIQKDLASTGRVVTQTLIGISLLLAFLFYLDLSIGGFLPAPPLIILLSIMWAIPLLPYVVLALFLPPLLGHLPKLKPRWDSLRERYPFWAIYCAVLGGLAILYVPLTFFPVYMYTSLVFWGMFLGSSCLAMAAIMLMFPRRESCKIVGLFLVIMAALSWVGTLGGALLGSLLCVAAGGHAYAWRPLSGS